MKVVSKKTLSLFRTNVCECCGKVGRTEPAHIFARGHGGGTRLDVANNLVALNPECHRNHHHGQEPTKQDLLEIVAKRTGRTASAIRDEIMELMRRPKPNVAAATRTPRKPREKKPHKVIGTPPIAIQIEEDSYALTVIPTQYAGKVFRLLRLQREGESEVDYAKVVPYDCHADEFGLHCDCKGHLRHHHCKHTDSLEAAGLLSVSSKRVAQ